MNLETQHDWQMYYQYDRRGHIDTKPDIIV